MLIDYLIGFGGPLLFFAVLFYIHWRLGVSERRRREGTHRGAAPRAE